MVLHNPNNWHWVDKNCIAWARDYFRQELVGLSASENDATVTLSEMKSAEGDVEVCQRKGKVISLFDVVLDLGYKGKVGDIEVTGAIKVPEVSYDNEADDFQFQISVDNDSNEKSSVKQLVRKKLVPQLRAKLANFGPTLIKTHGGNIQHSGNEPIHWSSSSHISKATGTQSASKTTETTEVPTKFGVSVYNTTSLTMNTTFNASPDQLYATFLTPQLVSIWSRSSPNMDPKVGGKFSLFGGNISGKYIELTPNEQIKMEWRLKDWKNGHLATLIHKFVVKDNETEMVTSWEGIPVGQEETVEQNFSEYYVKPIKATFGYGIL